METLDERHLSQRYLEAISLDDELELQRRRQDLIDFGQSFGIIRDIVKARNTTWRIVWIALALTAFSWCTYEINILVNRYLAVPTNTKFTYKVNSSMDFPIVTICTYSRVNFTRVKELNIEDDLLTFMLSAFKGMYSGYNDYNMRNRVTQMDERYQAFAAAQSNFSLTEFFIENGFECEQFLRSCMFQGVSIPCCGYREVLSGVGKCFVIRSEKYPVQQIPGPTGGLRVYVDNWAKLYPESMINTNPDMGIQIHIISPSSTTYVGVSPLVIFPGTHALVRLNAVHRKLRKDETKPNTSCTDSMKLKYFDMYSFEGCFTECIADLTVKTCGCIQIGSIPNYQALEIGDARICKPAVASECVQPMLQANNMGFLWDMYDIKVFCDCPIPCNEWNYETSVSYSQVPNAGYRRAQQSQNAAENRTVGEEDYIVIDLFYGDLVYTKIEETVLIGGTIFLSRIGGQMSLWLGIRLVSVAQLAYYIFQVLIFVFPIWLRKLELWRLKMMTMVEEEEEQKKNPGLGESPSRRPHRWSTSSDGSASPSPRAHGRPSTSFPFGDRLSAPLSPARASVVSFCDVDIADPADIPSHSRV